jgi:hypothetical protein
MAESLLIATALRSDNIFEQVLYSDDISTLIKEESELIFKLFRDELQPTSKYLLAECFRKSYKIVVKNLESNIDSERNRINFKNAFKVCGFLNDLYCQKIIQKIFWTLFGEHQRMLEKNIKSRSSEPSRMFLGRTNDIMEVDNRLYFWTCGYSANVRKEKHECHNANTLTHQSGTMLHTLVGTLELTMLSCRASRFDRLKEALSGNFDEIRDC